MENGSYTIQTVTNGVTDLSAAKNLLINTSGALVAAATDLDVLGSLEANAESAAGGLRINLTYAGTATCIASAAINPYLDVMVDAANVGMVIPHVAAGSNVAVGKYLPELVDGQANAAAAGDEITVHLYAAISIY